MPACACIRSRACARARWTDACTRGDVKYSLSGTAYICTMRVRVSIFGRTWSWEFPIRYKMDNRAIDSLVSDREDSDSELESEIEDSNDCHMDKSEIELMSPG